MDPNSIADAVAQFAALAAKIADGVSWLISQSAAAREKSWTSVLEATTSMRYLSRLHLEMVQSAVRPVIEAGDVGTTSELYTKLTNNPSLPEEYGSIRGTLEEAKRIKPFNRPELSARIDELLTEMGKFQHAAFMYVYGTYHFADNLATAAQLWQRGLNYFIARLEAHGPAAVAMPTPTWIKETSTS